MLAQELAQFVAERDRRGIALARVPDQPLEMLVELELVRTVGTAFQVELQLENLRRVQLAVDETIELLRTVLTVHCCT